MMKTVGPTSSTKKKKMPARLMFNWLRRLTPPSSPATTEAVAAPVMAAIRITWNTVVSGVPNRKFKPAETCLTPNPSDEAEAEQGGNDRHDVDRVAPPTVDPVTEDRVEHRTHRERQSTVEREEGQSQAHQGVDRPGMQSQ